MDVKGKKIEVTIYCNETRTYKIGYIGTCLGIGVDHEEYETNAGNYSCFIIMKDDGKVELEYCNLCRIVL